MECFMDMGTCLWQKKIIYTLQKNICYGNNYKNVYIWSPLS